MKANQAKFKIGDKVCYNDENWPYPDCKLNPMTIKEIHYVKYKERDKIKNRIEYRTKPYNEVWREEDLVKKK